MNQVGILKEKKAMFYEKHKNDQTLCFLCPHNCLIKPDKRGICGVRKNISGTLYSEVYGQPIAMHSDPVEKKPLYHFYPGKTILSIGTIGCNLKCFYCQNCDISMATPDTMKSGIQKSPESLVDMARNNPGNIGIAYTYNEPTIYFEYMYDTAALVKENSLKNVVVTNGFINIEPLKTLFEVADAFNVDIKAFNEDFYRKHTKSSLKPVLDSISEIAKKGKHLELTNLVIPGLNDDPQEFAEMISWIEKETGAGTPLHLSRYFPRHLSNEPSTPFKTLQRFYDMAKKKLHHVYMGNIATSNEANTYCDHCGHLVIIRNNYSIKLSGLNSDGRCEKCGQTIIDNI